MSILSAVFYCIEMKLILRTPNPTEFEKIKLHIEEYELDDRELHPDQFVAAVKSEKVLGFGRLRKHHNCIELCSLGVITKCRRKGIGKAIVAELIRKAQSNIYLVCVIPEYFVPFNFSIVSTFPECMKSKLIYCRNELFVPQEYVVMLRKL
ncbi:MAG: hypothetical protein K0S44_1438 [Bacteroidetes bacterium]|nr:hypothetical protein [Bacteroidota bacterium]